MHEAEIKKLMGRIRNKKISVDEAVKKLKFLPFEDLGFVKRDHHRALRKGFPEVVFCQNKTIKQAVEIIRKLSDSNNVILATRATKEMFKEAKKYIKNAQFNEKARTIVINKKNRIQGRGKILE